MELFTNRDTKFLFTGITAFMVGFLLLSQIGIWVFRDSCIPFISVLSVIEKSKGNDLSKLLFAFGIFTSSID